MIDINKEDRLGTSILPGGLGAEYYQIGSRLKRPLTLSCTCNLSLIQGPKMQNIYLEAHRPDGLWGSKPFLWVLFPCSGLSVQAGQGGFLRREYLYWLQSLEADRIRAEAFEAALVWMELKPGVGTPRPIAQHTVLLDWEVTRNYNLCTKEITRADYENTS